MHIVSWFRAYNWTLSLALEMKLYGGINLFYFFKHTRTQTGNLDPFHFMADQFHRKYGDTLDQARMMGGN